jgi:signal transduction histidine kinase/ligand-binding sensor domain-containing protein
VYHPPNFARFIKGVLICSALTVCASAEQLPIRVYTSADGLGSGFVDYVMRDSLGFMWFCTRDGLSRFDGAHFVTYRLGDKNSPPGIEGIFETRNSTYWVTTSAGMFRFHGDAISRPEKTADGRPYINAEFVTRSQGIVHEDPLGTVWYGGNILARLSEQNGKLEWHEVELNFPATPNRSPLDVISIIDAPDGSKWIATNRGVVRYLPDGRTIIFLHPATVRQGSIAMVMHPNGNLWAAFGKEIFIIKPEPLETLPQFDKVQIKQLSTGRAQEIETGKDLQLPQSAGQILQLTKKVLLGLTMRMYKTSDDHIWISSIDELLEFDGKVFHSYTTAHGLPGGMYNMSEDTSGNLWIGGRNGLTRLDRRGLTSFGTSDGLSSQSIFAVNESRERLYVANGDFYVSTFDGQRFTSVRPNLDPDARPLWTSRYAFLSGANEWWILTTTKLYRFSAGNLRTPIKTYTSEDGFKADQMFQIFEDSHGNIWVSQQPDRPEARGLYVLRSGEQQFFAFSAKENFPEGKSAMSFAEDRSGNLWMGFYEGDLVRYRNGRFDVFTVENGLPSGLISDLLIDQKGRLWIATSRGGLGSIDDVNAVKPAISALTTENGLSSNNVRTLIEDRFGNVYAGTVRGVDKIGAETQRVRHYSIQDGLASDFVVDSHCDRNGVLWFATNGGLSKLVPDIEKITERPPVWLSALRIAGEEQPVAELGDLQIQRGDLEPTRNNLQIDFFGLSFRAGETLRYQYMLEGADRDWSTPSELRTVSYANLKPGSYRFLVRAINADGLTSDKPAVVSFRILSPIYLRWWFIALVLVVVVALAYVLYRYRLARLREVNAALREAKLAEENLRKAREEKLLELERVRKRIATDLHDDVGSSLTRISLLSEVSQLQGRSVETPSGGSLSVIANLSRELVDSMSDIVWAINPEKDSLSDLTQRMRHFASDVFTARGIIFRLELPDSDGDVRVSATFRRELFLIFKEAVNNVVRHSGCTTAEIEFRMDGQGVILQLTDNGHGFDVQSKSNGHGLMSMRSRIESFSGKVEITSGNDGTTLLFTIPRNGFSSNT